MDANEFAFWLWGNCELNPDFYPTPEQWKQIKAHLALVFTKVTPPLTTPNTIPPHMPRPTWTWPHTLPPEVTCQPGTSPGSLKTLTICSILPNKSRGDTYCHIDSNGILHVGESVIEGTNLMQGENT